MSIYSKNQYSNREDPYSAPYPYYIPFLNGGNPQTMYPYDALYDQKYQMQNSDPKYQYYGNMEYPYYVQRHRSPHVYFDPKPTKYWHSNGFQYRIPPYPPYIYWYPNPVECRDVCGNNVCDAYYNAMNNYRNCKRCQQKDPPQCWDSTSQKCTDCPPEEALEGCQLRTRYGCANPRGFPHADVPPINPKYTGCKMCTGGSG